MEATPPLSPSPLAGEGLGRGGRPSPKLLLERAKAMRTNPTEAEAKLWSILRGKRLCHYKFKRQVVIDRYIVDFINFQHRIIIETDGSQHAESTRDMARDAYLSSQNFRVLRFWNNDILGRPNAICEAILSILTPPLPNPSPARGEGLSPSISGDNL